MEKKYSVTIYTDGSCLGNPGPGGWAARLIDNKSGRHKDIFGGEAQTTNNRMELLAVISALQALKAPSEVTIYSDSNYIIKAFNENWLSNWKRKNWVLSSKKPVSNCDLWQSLDALTQIHSITWSHVAAHVGIEHNEACDTMAKAQASLFSKQ